MSRMFDLHPAVSGISSKKLNRCRSFHVRYVQLCRIKNVAPFQEIRTKNHENSVLDFFGDKVSVKDWLLIQDSLFHDLELKTIAIRLRKNDGVLMEQIDTEKKANMFKQKPAIFTKFVFNKVIEGVVNCIRHNKNLRSLSLEGLPLSASMPMIAAALDCNQNLKYLSLHRSYIGDQGCEIICNTIKHMMNIEQLNLADCHITEKGAEHITNMLKVHKINRFTESWQQSLRYRTVNPDTIPGLRAISLAHNPDIGDNGLENILETLKEDCWVRTIDMENCGLTDRAGNLILNCLDVNRYITDFHVRGNIKMSKFIQNNIQNHLGKDAEDQKDSDSKNKRNSKETSSQLLSELDKLIVDLKLERLLRARAEKLNKHLTDQLMAYKKQLEEKEDAAEAKIPHGHVLVRSDSLQSIIRDRNALEQRVKTMEAEIASDLERASKKQQKGAPAKQNATAPSESVDICRKIMKVRKVKSETKYVDTPRYKDVSKKKESKSDHECANEVDFKLTTVQFETNIGDSITVGAVATQTTARIERYQKYPLGCGNARKEMDVSSSGSSTLKAYISSEQSTLFKKHANDPKKLFFGPPLPASTPMKHKYERENRRGEGDVKKSPRSLFLGL